MKHSKLTLNHISNKFRYIKMIMPFVIALVLIASCKSYNNNQTINNEDENSLVKSDTVHISSDESDYEIIIIEPGFNAWLIGRARPEGFHSQQWLESRNAILVQAWNQRALQPMVYDPNLYELRIDYDIRTDYGYEVNYKLYNYFLFFQLKYKQQLSSFYPRI
ncbi:DUF6146 family protein [Winogradskyella sp. PG-2]|uniref:DUF6146 family protein n=1 Tax=Winogradskyella sp. PG-2 TaxID=754409 RepID=UPI001E505AB0|nr:DUF6146 family protein [Winogradskyella sp. PG-2]